MPPVADLDCAAQAPASEVLPASAARPARGEGGEPTAAGGIGRWNIAVGWCSIALSLAAGAVLGLWAFGGPFTPPAWFGSYDDPGRRLLRLAHIAAVMLPILNFHFLRALPGCHFRRVTAVRACALLLTGSVGLPLLLAFTAIWRPALYLLPVPVTAVLAPVALVAGGLTAALLKPRFSTPSIHPENDPCVSD